MLKPDLLRQMISQHVPWLRENPDNLAVYLRKGRMVSTGQRAASFDYRLFFIFLPLSEVKQIKENVIKWIDSREPLI